VTRSEENDEENVAQIEAQHRQVHTDPSLPFPC
jgi:hypothetical protein